MSELDARFNALEARTQRLEDQIQIYQLISAYGPLVDSGDAEATAALWVADGVYDWGGAVSAGAGGTLAEGAAGAAVGRDAIAGMVRGSYHQAIIENGAGHVSALPHIVLDGDRATAVSCSRLYRRDGDQFRVWRVAANLWTLVRTADGWLVRTRTNRVLNGDPEARALLRGGVIDRARLDAD